MSFVIKCNIDKGDVKFRPKRWVAIVPAHCEDDYNGHHFEADFNIECAIHRTTLNLSDYYNVTITGEGHCGTERYGFVTLENAMDYVNNWLKSLEAGDKNG